MDGGSRRSSVSRWREDASTGPSFCAIQQVGLALFHRAADRQLPHLDTITKRVPGDGAHLEFATSAEARIAVARLSNLTGSWSALAGLQACVMDQGSREADQKAKFYSAIRAGQRATAHQNDTRSASARKPNYIPYGPNKVGSE